MSNVRSPQYKLGRNRRTQRCLLEVRCSAFGLPARSRCSELLHEQVCVTRRRPGSGHRAGPSVLRRPAHQPFAREFSSLRRPGLPVLRRAAHRRSLRRSSRRSIVRRAPARWPSEQPKSAISSSRPCAIGRSSSTLVAVNRHLLSVARCKSSSTRGAGSPSSIARASNHSIERTFQRPLRALWPAAHVER